MIHWVSIPFFRFTLAFMAGILISIHYPLQVPFAWGLAFFILLYIVFFFAGRTTDNFYALKPYTGSTGLLILLFFGATLTELRKENHHVLHIGNCKKNILFYKAVVLQPSEERSSSYRTEIEIVSVKMETGWRHAKGKLLLYTPKKNFRNLHYGDHVLIQGSPSPAPPPANPGEFDFQSYLSFRQIYHTHFSPLTKIKVLEQKPPSQFIYASLLAREKANAILKEYILQRDECTIASALLLGMRGTLDPDLQRAYSSTGTIHVLAVSGLHVTVVVAILMALLSFMKTIPWGRIFYPAFLIVLLWCYAFITGFSASVLRAVVMFSLIIIARSLQRNINMYNTFSLSAFILLCIDPFLIMDVGFQLSFLAVLGILYYQPKLYAKWQPDHYIVDKAWALSSGSIAAQLSTLPLCLFYFHKFPLCFLLANLMAIPLSSLVLYSGTLLLLFFWIPGVNTALGWTTGKLIQVMNFCIQHIENIPYASISGIHVSMEKAIVLTFIVLLATGFLHFKKIIYLQWLAVLIALFAVLQCHEIISHKHQRIVIAFKLKNHTAIGVVEGTSITVIADTSFIQNKEEQAFHLTPYLISHGIADISFQPLDKTNLRWLRMKSHSLLIFHGKTFLIEHSHAIHDPLPFPCDYLIPQKRNAAVEINL